MRFFILSPPGLEAVCAAEVVALGLARVETVAGGITCEGRPADALRLNLALRIGGRVLVELGEGATRALPHLVAAAELHRFLAPGTPYALDLRGGGQQQAALLRTAEAALARHVPGARRVETDAAQRLLLRVERGRLRLALDASGEPLHRRGYRQETGPAPVQENVAAGILALAGYDGGTPLVDPMCGSGTFLIEGALLALGRAPGLQRAFACEHWPLLPPAERVAIRGDFGAVRSSAPPILGSDWKAGALGVSRRNAERAGVRAHLQLERREVGEAAPPPGAGPGVVVTNPPYGRRLGERKELTALYGRLGQALLRRFGGWTAAILLADPSLVPALGLPDPRIHPLSSGGLRLHLVLAELPA